MNMQHTGRLVDGAPVRDYASAAEMREHAKQLKARLMGPAPKPPVVVAVAASAQAAKRWVLVEEDEAQLLAQEAEKRRAALEAERRAFRPEVPDLQMMAGGHRWIIRAIAQHHGVLVAEIKGQRRTRDIVVPRQQAMAALWIECPHLSLPQIGRLVGGKDHTTVLHAIRKLGVWKPRAWTPELAWLRNLVAPAPAASVGNWDGEGCA